MGEYLDKSFYRKMAIVPFGAVLVLMLAQGITWGFKTVLPNWSTYLVAFIFLSVVIYSSLLIVSRRLIRFLLSMDKHPFILVASLFINSVLIVMAKPAFVLNPPTLSEALPYIILVSLAWLIFPFVVIEKTSQKIPRKIRMPLAAFSYLITIFSVLLMAMVDALVIFFLFIGP